VERMAALRDACAEEEPSEALRAAVRVWQEAQRLAKEEELEVIKAALVTHGIRRPAGTCALLPRTLQEARKLRRDLSCRDLEDYAHEREWLCFVRDYGVHGAEREMRSGARVYREWVVHRRAIRLCPTPPRPQRMRQRRAHPGRRAPRRATRPVAARSLDDPAPEPAPSAPTNPGEHAPAAGGAS